MGARKATQLRQHGGRRPGAGRKPGPGRRNVRHRERAELASRFPVLVTLRADRGVGNLRRKQAFPPIQRAFADVAAAAEGGAPFRIVHYSVQKDHIHLLVEARDRTALSRGMQGLGIRVAKALNRALGRPGGRVWADRYQDRILRTPSEVRHALACTLQNARKHGVVPPRAPRRWVDPCSSAPWFDGWQGPIELPAGDPRWRTTRPPVASPRTWLLRVGWRRHGLLVPWGGADG
jgi:REP element-mobilizing transposase RayT